MEQQSKQVDGLSSRLGKPRTNNKDRGTHATVRRKANVYDAVAGRIAQNGFIGISADFKASTQPLRPDEVLFKQAKAPVRYEETDYYYAHATTAVQQQLPDGDLLSAIHAYVSKLFSRTAQPGHDRIWRCMDETALIACGIILEEMAREELGATGDLALTEAADVKEEAPTKETTEPGNEAPTGRDTPVDGPHSSLRSKSRSSDSSSNYTVDESA
ncbi:hypothetical protein T440DRAFT_238132 [Plenodomus tracheiphilus IPT5]|uniref:Uncharacterized protein n=1 Tax=Plenodomus tracheiphilus IPT5 TaxID=1408161 RepID=A0A6A7BKF4_9PLEO|nr:hypothetical protein T440DRAFT_238132 [Plenodomus tracheiphilus IPT5]